MFDNLPDILTIEDLQKALGVGRSTAYRLARTSIKHWRIGKTIKIPKLFLIDYITNSCYNDGVTVDSPSEGGIKNDGEPI